MQQPEIILLPERKMAGISARLCLNNDTTLSLWKQLMPLRKYITGLVEPALYSVQIFDAHTTYHNFRPDTVFEKWAAVEVAGNAPLPAPLQYFTIPAGLYAVFVHKGLPATYRQTLASIYEQWLPASAYLPDHRPHFDVMDERYKPHSPDSEEEIWVPVKLKPSTEDL